MEQLSPKKPTLYLIPCPLGENAPMEVLIVENEKDARRFIKRLIPQKDQSELVLFPLNKFTDPMELQNYLKPMEEGYAMGLLSDAGCPGVAVDVMLRVTGTLCGMEKLLLQKDKIFGNLHRSV